jgi:hypothetical protein
MAIILKANKVNLFVSSVLFVFWYHSLNFLDTPHSIGNMQQMAQESDSVHRKSSCPKPTTPETSSCREVCKVIEFLWVKHICPTEFNAN